MAPPWIAAQTRQLLAQRGHAWLLHGPSGLGQYGLGLALVRAWLCDRPGPDGSCGECGGCHAADVRAHGDLCVLMPETQMLELGWPLSEKAQTELDEKKRKPSKEIRIDAMRDAVEFSRRTSGRGRGKAVLVYPAERMNPITANALLKTLEEPAGDMKFVLASEASHRLLPTIRSRCISHSMVWPETATSLSWLGEQGIAASEAVELLRAAGGRPEDAMQLAAAGRTGKSWSLLPKAVARGDVNAVSGFTPAQTVDALQKICHDLLSIGVGATPRFFAAAELPPAVSTEALSAWWRELAGTATTVEHPFNAGLMLEALVSQARIALNSGQPARP